jgi:hypothetical protein
MRWNHQEERRVQKIQLLLKERQRIMKEEEEGLWSMNNYIQPPTGHLLNQSTISGGSP